MTATISAPEATARPSPEQTGNSGELTGVTPELRALLMGYTDALDSVHNAPAFFLLRRENPELPRWVIFPVLRYFVSAIFVRYLYRCAAALKSGVMRRGVVSDTADEHNGDLKILEQFEESLPRKLRLGFNLPVGLMVVLSVAYLLALWWHAAYRNLLGDLMAAAVTVNRTAAIAAFGNANRLANLEQPLEAYFFAGAAMIVAWSSVVAVLPLLPALYVVRRKRARLADVEARAFDTLRARSTDEIQLDLIVRLLLVVAVALLGLASVTQAVTNFPPTNSKDVGSIVIGAISVPLTILAGIELGACYRERRHGTAHCRSLATKVSFALVTVLATSLFVTLPFWERKSNLENNFWHRNVSTKPPKSDDSDDVRGWLTNQLSFVVTKIEQHAHCVEPHGLLINHPQYLRFVLEVWSDVDQFANPTTAHALALPHWSVVDKSGNDTGSLYMHPNCGRGTEAISEPIVPGAHTITDVVVSAPTDAASLQLDVPSYRGVWQWDVPPATG